MCELLDFLLGHGIKIVLITSKRIKSTRGNLQLLVAEHYFQALITPDVLQNPKPHPDSVYLALEETGATKEEALVVGDTYYDIAAGSAAQVATVAVTWGNHTRAELEQAQPTYYADTVAQLKAIIAKLM